METLSWFMYLDPLVKVLLKIGTIHDAILNRVGAIDEQLDLVLLAKLLHRLALPLEGLLARLLGHLGGHPKAPLLRDVICKGSRSDA